MWSGTTAVVPVQLAVDQEAEGHIVPVLTCERHGLGDLLSAKQRVDVGVYAVRQRFCHLAMPPTRPRGHVPAVPLPRIVYYILCVPLLLGACASYEEQPLDLFAELDRLEHRLGESPEPMGDAPPLTVGSIWVPLEGDIDSTDGLNIAEANALTLFYAPEIRAARHVERVRDAEQLGAGLLANPELFVGPRFSTGGEGAIVPAGVSWELPLWGARAAERDLARHRWTAAEARVLAAELRSLVRVRRLFIRLAAARKLVAVLESQVAVSARVAEWGRALQEAGDVDSIDGYLTQLDHAEGTAALLDATLKVQVARGELLKEIGLLPTADVVFVFDPDPTLLPALPPSERERVLKHPTISAVALEYNAAEAELALEVARQYPRIRLGPEFEDDDGRTSIGFGLGVELPLFDRNQGDVRAAEERRVAARQRVLHALIELLHEEAEARATAASLQSALETYRGGALGDADNARSALERRLNAGEAGVLEVLTTLRTLTRARLREVEYIAEVADARLRAAAAGGLLTSVNDDRESDGAIKEATP